MVKSLEVKKNIKNIKQKIEELQTDKWNNQLDIFEVFTHEWAIDKDTKKKMEYLCKWSKKENYNYCFIEDIISEEE